MTEPIITEDNVFVSNDYPNDCIADASELGLPPGWFPGSFETTLGNKQPFFRVSVDPECVVYSQSAGCLKLIVVND